MQEDILDAYRRLLEAHAIPFDEIARPGDWHVTLFVVASFEPEQVFDVDHRAGRTLLHRTRLLPSLWSAVMEGKRAPGRVAPVTAERACAELPAGNPLVGLVCGEHLFRMRELEAVGLDGTSCTLVHSYHGGVRRIAAWEPSRDPRWARLLGEIREASALLPRRA